MLQEDPSANRVMEVVVVAANIPSAYTKLMDLGSVFMRKGMKVDNQTNAAIRIKFLEGDTGDNVVTVQASTSKDFQQLRCYGEVDYQYVTQPSTGTLTVSIW